MINTSNSSAAVGTSPVVLSEEKINAHSERVRLIVSNTSVGGQVIYLAADATPVVGAGLPLNPGGSMAWEKQAGVPIQQKRVQGVSDLAGGTVSVYEEVAQ